MTFRHWELARRRPVPRQRADCTGLAAAVRIRRRLFELGVAAACDHAGESTTLTMHTADLLRVLEAAVAAVAAPKQPDLVKVADELSRSIERSRVLRESSEDGAWPRAVGYLEAAAERAVGALTGRPSGRRG